FQRAINVTGPNVTAQEQLAQYDLDTGQLPAAVQQFEALLAKAPQYAPAEANLGGALAKLEGCASAMPHFEAAIRLDPKLPGPHTNLGRCLELQMDYTGAVRNFEAAIHLSPEDVDVQEG